MLKKIFSFSTDNPFLSITIGIVVMISGFYLFTKLSVDVIPDIGENQQIIITNWNGHSPDDVEEQITYPLSISLQGLPSVKTIRGTSAFGLSMIYIIFEDDAEFYFTRDRIIEKLAQVKNQFPKDASMRLGPDSTGINQIFWYTLKSDKRDLEELRTLQDWVVKFQLTPIKGVSEVASIGGYKKEYQIEINPDKLYKYNIPLKKVIKALKESNKSVGSRTITENDMEYIVYSNGQLKSLKDVRDIVVDIKDEVPIFMKNIAEVQYGSGFRYGILDDGGKEAVGGVITMRKGENPIAVIKNIKSKIKQIEKGLPEDIKIVPFYDRSEMIDASLENLKSSMIHELVVTIIIVLLFLLNFVIASIIIMVLPISIAATFGVMYFMGIDANIMSLAGIIIAFGAIVDVGIIFIENIYNSLSDEDFSKSLNEASPNPSNLQRKAEIIKAASIELGGGLLTAVLTTVISFLPVFLLTGQEGKLFTPLAWTKTILLISSIIFTLLVIPPLSMLLIKIPKKREDFEASPNPLLKEGATKPSSKPLGGLGASNDTLKNFSSKITLERKVNNGIKKGYSFLLGNLLKVPYLFLVIPIFIVATALYLAPKIGNEYMPPLDEGDIVFMPVTSNAISLEKAKELLQKQDAIIKSFPEVKTVVGKSGRAESAFDPAPTSMFETTIRLKDPSKWRKFITIKKGGEEIEVKLTKKTLLKALDQALKIPGVANIWTQPISNRIDMVSTGIRTEVGIKIFGDDLKVLQQYVNEIKNLLGTVKGVKNLYGEQMEGKPYLTIDIDRVKASRYGLNIFDIQQFIEIAIGGKNLTTIFEGRKRFPVKLSYSRDIRDQLDEISKLKVTLKNGTQIPLSYVAKIETKLGASMINSENGILRAYILFDIESKDKIGFINKIKKLIDEKIKFKTGYIYDIDGKFKHQISSKKMLKLLVPISLFLIFLLIFLLFKKVSTTLIIFSAIPITLSGGVIFLYLSGQNSSVAVWVGFIALFGIAVDDGIIIATFLTQKVKNLTKENIKKEIIEGGSRRIRPLLMTTATTLIALVPILYSDGRGSEFMKPMAIPVIGGLTVEFLTLFLVPTLFYLYYRKKVE